MATSTIWKVSKIASFGNVCEITIFLILFLRVGISNLESFTLRKYLTTIWLLILYEDKSIGKLLSVSIPDRFSLMILPITCPRLLVTPKHRHFLSIPFRNDSEGMRHYFLDNWFGFMRHTRLRNTAN